MRSPTNLEFIELKTRVWSLEQKCESLHGELNRLMEHTWKLQSQKMDLYNGVEINIETLLARLARKAELKFEVDGNDHRLPRACAPNSS